MKKLLLIGACIVPLFSQASYKVTIPVEDFSIVFKNKVTDNTTSPTEPEVPVITDPVVTPPVETPVEPEVPVIEEPKGNWIVTSTVYSDWVTVGDVYDYDDDAPDVKLECKWHGNPAMTQKGLIFTRYRDCYQDQERIPTVTETNDITGEVRNKDLEKEIQRIETEEEEEAVGTRVDFEEFTSPNYRMNTGNLQIVGAYSLDGVVLGSPIINSKGSRIYLHFVHNTTTNTYMIELFGKDDDTAPSSTSYEGRFFNSFDYFRDIKFINYVDSNGKVADIYLASSQKTTGYQQNYSKMTANISAEQFNAWYNNPNSISTFRIHLNSMDTY